MGEYRVKPGKGASALGFVGALGMALFGVFVIVPLFGSAGSGFGPIGSTGSAFAILWVLAAFGIAAFYGYNLFSERGASVIDIEVPQAPASPETATTADFDDRLRKLEGLRRDGVITEDEYEAKRAEILGERW